MTNCATIMKGYQVVLKSTGPASNWAERISWRKRVAVGVLKAVDLLMVPLRPEEFFLANCRARILGQNHPLIFAIAHEFGFDQISAFGFISGGGGVQSGNIPWFEAGRGKFLIKQIKSNHSLGEGDVLYCLEYMHYLMEKGIPIPAVARSGVAGDRARSFFVKVAGRFYSLDRWVEGLDISTAQAPATVFENVGEMLAHIHFLSLGFTSKYSRNPAHYSVAQALAAIKTIPTEKIGEKDRDCVLAIMKKVAGIDLTGLPRGHIPSDFNFANIKFNSSGQPITVFDWDNTRYAYRLEDVPATVTQTGRRGEGYNLHPALVSTAIAPLVRGYNRKAKELGYTPFLKEELEVLPFLYRVGWLYRLYFSLTKLKIDPSNDIQAMKLIEQIFNSSEWRDFLASQS